MRTLTRAAVVAAIALALVAPAVAHAQATTYRVTITNITQNQIFSPPLVATHRLGAGIFKAGESADMALRLLAEDGDPSALETELGADPGVLDVAVSPGPVLPGESVTLEVEARPPFFRLSAVGMLVTTNDGFFGLDSFAIVGDPWLKETSVPAYDAGTEANSEDCTFIPGPPCGNGGVRDTGGAEGFISVHPGIRGTGDLDAATFDWRNPAASIRVVRVGG